MFILQSIISETQHLNFSRPSGSWIIDQNNILHVLINNSWNAWPTKSLKVDVPIVACIFFTFNWLTLTSEMHFVMFFPEVASCLLSRGKINYVPLGMRLLWKYIRKYFLVYHLVSHFLLYFQNYTEFEAEFLDLEKVKHGLSFDIKKWTTSGWALGDENVIGIRSFNVLFEFLRQFVSGWTLFFSTKCW